MPLYRATMVFPYFTGLPGDVSTNTMHWVGPSPAAVLDRIEPGMEVLGSLTPAFVSRSAHINIYDLDDPEPRVPVVRDVTLNAASFAAALPAEVAICASWAASPSAGIPVQSLRNRIYVGPLNTGCGTTSTSSTFPRVNSAVQEGIADVIQAWAEPIGSTNLIVYGPAHGVEALPVRGWVDDEFDTQRRRGVLASARFSWP